MHSPSHPVTSDCRRQPGGALLPRQRRCSWPPNGRQPRSIPGCHRRRNGWPLPYGPGVTLLPVPLPIPLTVPVPIAGPRPWAQCSRCHTLNAHLGCKRTSCLQCHASKLPRGDPRIAGPALLACYHTITITAAHPFVAEAGACRLRRCISPVGLVTYLCSCLSMSVSLPFRPPAEIK